MDQTTGSLLSVIVDADLSPSAIKLAAVILNGIAWKDGYNGLDRGTAAFTLAELGAKVGVSRQYLNVLLTELENSSLRLVRWKPNGIHAPWLFRFDPVDNAPNAPDVASTEGDKPLYSESSNKTVFFGKIEVGDGQGIIPTRFAVLIRAAKTALPCWNVDVQVIWDRFLAFNRARGNTSVPAGFLLGFMRKWRVAPGEARQPSRVSVPEATAVAPGITEAQDLARHAPARNREFHQQDLERLIGRLAYELRITTMMERLGLGRFTASLAVHGLAVRAGEIRA